MTSTKFALILAHNRHEELNDTLRDILPQVDMVLVFDNASEPPIHDYIPKSLPKDKYWVVRDSTQPPNLARFWNICLDQIHMLASEPYFVAVLTDDVRIPEGWFDAVTEAMDKFGAAAGCSTPWENRYSEPILKTAPDNDIMNRMFGPAYILRGESGIRANENLHWWWNDTDMDWKARGAGGMVVIPTHTVTNLFPNASTVGVLAERAGIDRQEFAAFWGSNPW